MECNIPVGNTRTRIPRIRLSVTIPVFRATHREDMLFPRKSSQNDQKMDVSTTLACHKHVQ